MFNYYEIKKNNLFKILVILFTVFLCISSIVNIIIASDIDHLLHCHNENCEHCSIIHFAQMQAKYMYLSISPMIIALIIINKQKFINLINEINKSKTLIECKIQLNI